MMFDALPPRTRKVARVLTMPFMAGIIVAEVIYELYKSTAPVARAPREGERNGV